MSTPEFARLEDVDLREAWRHEAHEFTPWLLENLDRLSQAIGIPLEAEGREIAVERFAADILARSPHNGERVLIENQLEQSDHTHLGQIMTYLAGLDAKTIIWIAPSFAQPHRSAIKWLNEATSEEFAFFAVEVRVVRIGNSPLAPVFKVIESPNDWERHLQAKARQSDALSDRGERNLAFWTRYLELVPDDQARGTKPNGTTNLWRVLPEADLVLSMFITNGSFGLFIRAPRGRSAEETRARLLPHAEQLEQALGMAFSQHGNSFFECDRKADPDDRAQWDEVIRWLGDLADRYEKALVDVLKDES